MKGRDLQADDGALHRRLSAHLRVAQASRPVLQAAIVVADGEEALKERVPRERGDALVLCDGHLEGAEGAQIEEPERLVARPRHEPVRVRRVPLQRLHFVLVAVASWGHGQGRRVVRRVRRGTALHGTSAHIV